MGVRVLVTLFVVVDATGSLNLCEDPASCEVHGGDETSLLARHVQGGPAQQKVSIQVPAGSKVSIQVETPGGSVQEGVKTPCTKIGTLTLDGYYWPTQPGDVNDKRTFCRVNPADVDDFNYTCELPYREDEYGSVTATVKGFTFAVAQKQTKVGMKKAFGNAVKYFLEDPDICAIICNVGFCSGYQSLTEEAIADLIAENPGLVRKPMLLGSPILALEYYPSMLPSLATKPVKALNAPDEVIIIITASFPSLSVDLGPLFDAVVEENNRLGTSRPSLRDMDYEVRDVLKKKAGMHCSEGMGSACMRLLESMHGGMMKTDELTKALKANLGGFRSRIYVVGWNDMPGYKPVDLSGGFHNAKLTSDNYRTWKYGGLDRIMSEIKQRGQKVVGVVIESTEQATNSNDIRIDFGLPVWDFSTVGICLGASAKGDFNASNPQILSEVFGSKSFGDCLLRWAAPGKVEPKFGKQPDGSFRFYNNLTDEEVMTLTCVGGRPEGHPPIGRLMKNFDIGVPDHPPVAEVCYTTELCKCHGPMMLSAVCTKACPGSGNCGGGNPPYPCGATGEKCATLADVPESAGKCYSLGAASIFGPALQHPALNTSDATLPM